MRSSDDRRMIEEHLLRRGDEEHELARKAEREGSTALADLHYVRAQTFHQACTEVRENRHRFVPAIDLRTPAWRSKARWRGKAHFVHANGKTACAASQGPRGMRMDALLTTSWRELDPEDHLCSLCAQTHPRVCECGSCRVVAESKADVVTVIQQHGSEPASWTVAREAFETIRRVRSVIDHGGANLALRLIEVLDETVIGTLGWKEPQALALNNLYEENERLRAEQRRQNPALLEGQQNAARLHERAVVLEMLRERAQELRDVANRSPKTEGALRSLKTAEELGRIANHVQRRQKPEPEEVYQLGVAAGEAYQLGVAAGRLASLRSLVDQLARYRVRWVQANGVGDYARGLAHCEDVIDGMIRDEEESR